MTNKRNWLGILVMVLVFGMMVVGCDNGSTNSDGNGGGGSLNGTWIGINADPSDPSFELTYNNGNYETSSKGVLWMKGTYATTGGIYTSNNTHVGGKYPFVTLYLTYTGIQLENKWYSKNELKTATDEYFESHFGSWFGENPPVKYSIIGEILSFTNLDDSHAGTYKRK
jgi:hypothetical protein